MPLIIEVETLAAVLSFAIWGIAVKAVAVAVFRSFFARELYQRLASPIRLEASVIRRAEWELRHNTLWGRDKARALASKDATRTFPPLTPEEERLRKLMVTQGIQATMLKRMVLYLWECGFCQSFWSALLLVMIFSTGCVLDKLISMLAYAFFSDFILPPFKSVGIASGKPCPGGGCG